MITILMFDNRDEKILRKKIEDQVAHERKAYKNVEKVVLSDSIEKHEFQDMVCRFFFEL